MQSNTINIFGTYKYIWTKTVLISWDRKLHIIYLIKEATWHKTYVTHLIAIIQVEERRKDQGLASKRIPQVLEDVDVK